MPLVGVVDEVTWEVERRSRPEGARPRTPVPVAALAGALLLGERLDSSPERAPLLVSVRRPPRASIARIAPALPDRWTFEPRRPVGGVELARGPSAKELGVCRQT